MINSIGYLAAFFFFWQGEYKRKKSSVSQNGLEAQAMSLTGVLCCNAMIAGLCKILHIPLGLLVISVSDVFFGCICWYAIYRKKEVQKHEWRFVDILGILGITLFCIILCVSVFTIHLKFRYTNSDAGLHLREATMVVRTNQVEGMYFSHFQNAVIIEILEPFLREVTWYKGYIAADIFFQWIEILIFFVWIQKFAANKFLTVTACLIVPLYYFAYPINSFYFSFTYWGMGVWLLIYILLLLHRIREENECRWILLLQLLFACFSICICYMLFAPLIFFCVFLELVRKKDLKEILLVFFVPCVLGIYFCYFDFFCRQGTSVLGSIQNEGGIYSNLFGNFVLWMPMAAYGFVHGIKKKKPEAVFFAGFLFMAAVMSAGVLLGRISKYYYYKCYYPIWAIGWYLFFYGVCLLYQKNKELLAAYFGSVFLCCFLFFSGMDSKFVSSMDEISGKGQHNSEVFDIYAWNEIYRSWGRKDRPSGQLELYEWVMLHCRKDEKEIPLLTEKEDYADCYFYEGVAGYDLGEFYGWRYSKEEVFAKIEEADISYAVVLKKSDFIRKHKEVINEYPIFFENEAGYVICLK